MQLDKIFNEAKFPSKFKRPLTDEETKQLNNARWGVFTAMIARKLCQNPSDKIAEYAVGHAKKELGMFYCKNLLGVQGPDFLKSDDIQVIKHCAALAISGNATAQDYSRSR